MQHVILKLRSLSATSGQDLIEYALTAGFVATASGALLPGVASIISTILSHAGSVVAILPTT
jgi:Flp pilus assembly pilin Flp